MMTSRLPEHDPEKWIPVFGKDHAPTKNPVPGIMAAERKRFLFGAI
jgi:hypothetical protein